MKSNRAKKVTISHGRIREVGEPNNMKDTLRRLMEIVRMDKKYFFYMFLTVLLASGLGLIIPYLIGRAIDMIGPNMDGLRLRSLTRISIVMFFIYFIDMLAKIVEEFLIIEISQSTIFRIRELSFSKLQKLPIIYFDMASDGEIMSRISNDVEDISTSISESLAKLISSIIGLVGSVSMMVYLSWELTLASLITVPITYIFAQAISSRTRELFRRRQEALGELNSHMEETIPAIDIVKSFNNEQKVIEGFKEKNDSLRRLGIEAQILSGIMMPIMNVIKYLNFTIIAVFGGYLASKKIISVGVIASFISYSKQFSRPLNDIANNYNTLQSGFAGAERIFEILDEEEEREDKEGALSADYIRGDIEFKNLSFQYVEGEPVLKNINFKVGAGMNVALVGPTGAGKTTIVNLLTGLYENYEGEILVDGRNILDYEKNSIRQAFASVLQDTYLFSSTIRDNISYGKLAASEEDILEAARASAADRFISRLDKGYDSDLFEAGINLSQGERQLIAISRAIISDPKILILDEATSSVDTKTELRIQKAMVDLMKERTSFIIAHRLSTIRDADMIMVIDGGRIVERGDHRSLLEKGGYYAELYKNQKLNI